MLRFKSSSVQPIVVLLVAACIFGGVATTAQPLELHLQRLVETGPGSNQWKVVETTAEWDPHRTAVIICDMWDKHWCPEATERVAELAPHINQVVNALRQRGVLIIHCPSATMKFYQGTPGRELAQSAPKYKTRVPLLLKGVPRDPADEPPLPIDDSDGGCGDSPPGKRGSPWRREIATIQIKPGDAITDNTEIYYLMHERGITNVIYMGVHENICIVNRPFGIRQSVRQGLNVVLIRDLTDCMYDSNCRPFVNHFMGDRLVTWHIEKYLSPTITSDQIIGGQPFRFPADTNPPCVLHNGQMLPQK